MKAMLAVLGLFTAAIHGAEAQDAPPMPKPSKEHEWLRALDGEWSSDVECATEPGKPPMKMKGSASGRSLGGFWSVLENRGEAFGTPFIGILTLGYDAEAKKYQGSWIDSMNPHHWRYTGAVDAAGKTLTLDTQGPSHLTLKTEKFQETIELQGKDAWTLTSSTLVDGKWVQFMKIVYTRKTS